jgi:4-amino-4-deoxychorismate lyase
VDRDKFIETIRIEDGALVNFKAHLQRMQTTVAETFGGELSAYEISSEIVENKLKTAAADALQSGAILKCRILYGSAVESITFAPYTPREVRSLTLVEAPDDLDYHLKYQDRSALTELQSQRGDSDEVIIVRRGVITDTSYSNLLIHSAKGLLTPASTLLNGTMRQYLINTKKATPVELSPDDLLPGNPLGITAVSLINAMLPPGRVAPIAVENIRKKH